MSITIESFRGGRELALPNISVFRHVDMQGVGPDGQLALFDHYLEFSPEFFHSILSLKHQPINNDALAQLRTALAIDVYLWAARRTFTVKDEKRFSWKQMQDQFGSPNEQPSKFRKAFTKAFAEVSKQFVTWGYGKCYCDDDGVVLINCEQQVPSLPTKAPGINQKQGMVRGRW
jgi:hypothetical protein